MKKVLAPGKLILSGEHSVVYGHPALAMAINRYAIATATPDLSPMISFDLADLSYERKLTLCALEELKSRVKKKYQRFIHGDFKIRDVLQKPFELAQFAFSLFFETLNLKLTHGVKIHVQSDIPMGCGMGSSAATILSVVHAVARHMKIDLTPDALFKLGLEAENLQHGFSSGLDLRVSIHGGCIFVKENEMHLRSVPKIPMYLINTGSPACGTGECVTAAADYFKTQNIGEKFASVTEAMDSALQQNQYENILLAIRENHLLLTTIGVVPEKVQNFVKDVEFHHGAAKVCGAGAISGDNAGVVLAVTEHEQALKDLCERYQYSILPIAGDARGVHVL
jgi:mevalonate kinase